jgi:DNA repair protein RecO (recombination protein O)
VTTRAVVLRAVDYRDSDRIVTLFTEHHGKVSAMARAARRSQKRFAGGLESLCVVEVTLEPGRGELETLREARPALPCLTLLTSLASIEAAGAGLELLRATLAERQPEPEVFALTVDFLVALDAGQPPGTRLLQFQLDTLDLLGFSPDLEQCGVCGKAAPEDRVALFRASAGAIVCRACGGGALRLSAATRRVLLAHRGRLGEPEPDALEEPATEWPKAVQAEARALVAGMLEGLIQRPMGTPGSSRGQQTRLGRPESPRKGD